MQLDQEEDRHIIPEQHARGHEGGTTEPEGPGSIWASGQAERKARLCENYS